MEFILNKDNIINNVNKKPGIYKFRNIINNKCYIGQAKILRTRILQHLTHFYNNNRKYPIYKAFEKYGLNNFTVEILSEYDKNTKNINSILDNEEKIYIQKYNSYGATGYNQTLGGDGGILGYKFTKEQKETLSKNSKIIQNDGRHKIYVYNVNTDTITEYTSFSDMSKQLNKKFKPGCLRNFLIDKQYLISKTLDKLNDKIYKYKTNNYKKICDTWYQLKVPKEKYDDVIKYYFTHTVPETAKQFNCSYCTIYNILKRKNIKLKTK